MVVRRAELTATHQRTETGGNIIYVYIGALSERERERESKTAARGNIYRERGGKELLKRPRRLRRKISERHKANRRCDLEPCRSKEEKNK